MTNACRRATRIAIAGFSYVPGRVEMNTVIRYRLRGAVLLAFMLVLAGCGGRGGSGTLPPRNDAMAMPNSVSPASIAAPPMARTVPQPGSAMSARTPRSAIAPVGFTQLPGAGVAVAASADGSIWVLSTQGTGTDQYIYHYANGTWTNIPGAAIRLAVAPNGTLWVVNSAGGIYSWNGSAWSTIAGGASEISIGSDNSVYVISNQGGGPYGRGIWRYTNGSWTQLPGAGVRIAASWDTGTFTGGIAPGGFYIVNGILSIYYYNPSTGFNQLPGAAVQLAPTTNGGVFALGYLKNPDGSFPIYYDNLATGVWAQQSGAAVSIATNTANVYVIGAAGGIYSAPVAPPGAVPAAPAVGYLAPTATGSFAGQLTSVTSGATVVGISTAELPANGSSLLSTDNLAFSLGSSVLSTGRQPTSVRPPAPAGPAGAVERPVHGPAEIAAITSQLHRTASGTRSPLAARRTSSLGTTVGSHTQFWVSVFAIGSTTSTDVQVGATLEAVANNGYVWVDDSLVGTTNFTPATITKLASDLDNAYVSDTTHFGTTAFTVTAPGESGGRYTACDNTGTTLGPGTSVPFWVPAPDGKIVAFVINSNGLGAGVGGYFTELNYIYQSAFNCLIGTPAPGGGVYTAQTIPHSNEAPMLYLGWNNKNPLDYETDEDLVRGTAHELQHLINFVNHTALNNVDSEESWINEGMSMLAQDFAVNRKFGLAHDAADALFRAGQFTSAPQSFSLTAFTGIDPGKTSLAYNCSGCYGAEFLFQRYLYDRFGGDSYLHAMLGTQTGLAALQQATGTDPHALLSDFAIALAASGSGKTSDPRFGFASLNLPTGYPDQFGRTFTVGSPATSALPSSANAYVGSFNYYSVGASALNQNLSAKDLGAGFSLNVGVVQR